MEVWNLALSPKEILYEPRDNNVSSNMDFQSQDMAMMETWTFNHKQSFYPSRPRRMP